MYKRYDHRIKQIIHETKNPNLFPELGIPRSTALTWIKKTPHYIVTLDEFQKTDEEIIIENRKLKEEIEILKAKQELVFKTYRIFGFEVQYKRLPKGVDKKELLDLIKSSVRVLSLTVCLELIGLSLSRYNSWIKRSIKCDLEDNSYCPRINPTKLTSIEIGKIRQYVTSKDYSHYSINSLASKAKRNGDLFCSTSTWSRVIRELKLIRPRKRIYPSKPRIAVRAAFVNQIWHIDQTIYRLIDGTKCFIQAIIDNKSRLILAYEVTKTYGGLTTRALLLKALERAKMLLKEIGIPILFSDSGVENINKEVDRLITEGLLKRTIAQIEIDFSNSIIEAFFRSMKHSYLFFREILSFESLEEHVNFYVRQHNNEVPHHALGFAMPIEIYTGRWTEKEINELNEKLLSSKIERMSFNKALNCGKCPV